jgi:hypothetical protein
METPTTPPIEVETSMRAKIWKAAKWSAGIFLLINAVMILGRVGWMLKGEQTAKKVAAIHSIRLTLADVDGSKLPPAPDPILNDATVEGIDVNNNYVRDDIERYIFETYQDQKERAVWMQWARAEQLVMTHAESKETLKAIMEEGDRANQCATFLYRMPERNVGFRDLSSMTDSADAMVWNTDMRMAARDRGYRFMTSSGPMDGQQCDIFPEEK